MPKLVASRQKLESAFKDEIACLEDRVGSKHKRGETNTQNYFGRGVLFALSILEPLLEGIWVSGKFFLKD